MEGQENIAKDKNRRNKTIGYVFGALALVLIAGVSYAFLSVIKPEKNDFKTALSTGTMILTFADNNPTVEGSLGFGDSITKKFKIINDGTLASSLSIDWKELKNTYTNGSLVYKLNRTDEDGTLIETVLDETNVPTSSVPITQSLISEVSVPSETTYYYDLVITLKNLPDVIQDSDLKAEFITGFDVGIESSYRYYTLTVDPNKGTWGLFTAPQEYLLKHNETKEVISDPTRYGYDFNGWEIKGEASTINAGTFTMGISNTYLIAKWIPKKVTVTVNIDGTITTQEGDYEGTITLEEPTKEGHTFEGWNAVGGQVDGNNIKITNLDGVTVTPVWKPIDYQYIVYHNKMTTSGTYAPVDINTDKDTGTQPFGTEYPLPLKDYGAGFITPQQKTLLITSNEENNKWTYEYERNKYQLTVDPNGGTGGTNSQKVFFENTITLEAPTKTGYNFTRWNETSSTNTLTDNTVKMGTEDVTVQAEWTPKTIPIVLNANGGIFDNDSSITTKSTTVTYDSTYGEGSLGTLPTPARDGYKFAGWYTENSATDGAEVTDSTSVTIETDQTLYARWNINMLLVVGDVNFADKMWEHKANIIKVIFENTTNAPVTYAHSYDISNDGNSSVMAYLVTDPEDSSKYIAHIQASGKIFANINSEGLFAAFTSLKSIEGLEFLDTSKVTNMSHMFWNCNSLVKLDVSSFDTSNVINMRKMFDMGNNILTKLDLSNFNTSNVTDMGWMFNGCNGLTELNVDKFNTKNVTDMDHMFTSCISLTRLNVSNFNTSNVTNMERMFADCSSLTTLDVSNFDTSKVTNMSTMFWNCVSLTELNVSNFNTSNVTNMGNMFNSCISLTSLDVSNFNTSNVTDMNWMFNGCSGLTELNLSNFNTNNVTNMTNMFNGCTSLTSLNLLNWNVSSVTNTTNMFTNIPSSIQITVSNTDMKTWAINASDSKLTDANFTII